MKSLASILTLVLFLMAPFQVKSDDPEQLVLLIHPFLKNEQIKKRFSPLTQYLSNELGLKVTIKISDEYSSHIDNIGKGQFDIAYIGPYSYVKMTEQYGKKQILGRLEIRGRPVFQGKIVTKIDSTIRKVKDLKGKRFAFGDKSSTMSYIVPKSLLQKKGINLSALKSYQHYRSHSAVIDAVINGKADAGAVKEEMYYKNMAQLKSIATTPEISEHLFLANKTLSVTLIKKIKNALLVMNLNKQGLIAMRSIKSLMTGVVEAKHKDYENLSKIYTNAQ